MATQITNIQDWNTLLQLAKAGDNVAQFEVASHYDYGLIIADVEIAAEGKSNAFEWYYKAYKNGNDDAIIRTADFLSEGIYCDPDIELAIELYKKGIDNGSGISANNLAIIRRNKQEYKKAFELYEIAQNLGKSNSLQLALCYHFGIGTEKSIENALEILLKISQDVSEFRNCQYEVDEANYLLGRIYLDGETVERSIHKARHFLKLADTDNNHRSAQELLLVIGRNI
ncbi:tetratricopeptide repeat protein [Mucilaginibacter sp.]|uniref:tetratricopeptide repeat protein n=1 Tax=Mucilaginibacter sp. TaxID=1882438 RepID=UPI002605DE05|nr:tetratricopeptide repeat protein [Mucilaginibacter sp.]MDB4918597.1 Sel1 repeat protein [Mucilaginibacter sp.]